MKTLEPLRKAALALSALITGFVFISLVFGGGSQARSRDVEGWVYPVHALFHSSRHRAMTEKAVAEIFADHLKQSRPGIEAALARHLVRECRKYELDPAYILSLIQVESGFQVRVMSSAGAIGLLQLQLATGRHVARSLGLPAPRAEGLRNPFLNLTLGIAYVAELRDRYQGMSPYYALAAYNMGPGRLDELRSRPGFRPTKTLKYYQDVMKGVDYWRYYSSRKAEVFAQTLLQSGSRGKIMRVVEKR